MSDLLPPDDELVSAYLDGEVDPDERARVERSPELLARLQELRAAADAIGAPVRPPTDAQRDAAIQVALAARPTGTVVDLSTRSTASGRRYRPLAIVAAVAAAAILVVIGLPFLLRDRTSTQTALEAPTSPERESAPEVAAEKEGPAPPQLPDELPTGPTAGAGQEPTTTIATHGEAPSAGGPTTTTGQAARVYRGDLGTISDARQLRELALQDFESIGGPMRGEEAPSGQRDPDTVAAADACVGSVRASDDELGELVLAATARYEDQVAIVLVFAIRDDVGNANGERRAFALSAADCSVLLVETA